MKPYFKTFLLILSVFFIGCSQKTKPKYQYSPALEPIKVIKQDDFDRNILHDQFFMPFGTGAIALEEDSVEPMGKVENKDNSIKVPISTHPKENNQNENP